MKTTIDWSRTMVCSGCGDAMLLTNVMSRRNYSVVSPGFMADVMLPGIDDFNLMFTCPRCRLKSVEVVCELEHRAPLRSSGRIKTVKELPGGDEIFERAWQVMRRRNERNEAGSNVVEVMAGDKTVEALTTILTRHVADRHGDIVTRCHLMVCIHQEFQLDKVQLRLLRNPIGTVREGIVMMLDLADMADGFLDPERHFVWEVVS